VAHLVLAQLAMAAFRKLSAALLRQQTALVARRKLRAA
jgi:hypothetical protein